ncbi:MAG: hypothetical protein JWM87_771 [Candidatus Eremiobacteraeota bacterium]|nr:hypothetical protein [Candidatus Eremiobacteraeota bacterium]
MPHSLTNTHRSNLRRIPVALHYRAHLAADPPCGNRYGRATSHRDAVTCRECREGLGLKDAA